MADLPPAGHMRAVLARRYGPVWDLEINQVDRPALEPEHVLVRVRTTSVNHSDRFRVTGTPLIARLGAGLLRPSRRIPGVDVAGTVAAVGSAVSELAPGEEVFGFVSGGTFADYVAVPADQLLRRPPNVTVEQAGVVPVSATTALQALRDRGRVRPGDRVIVNGASGGVGTFAVQIAKLLGAEVIAVCSTRNLEQARRLGASSVIDYTVPGALAAIEDSSAEVFLDIAGSVPLSEVRRHLTPAGRYVLVGGAMNNTIWGPVGRMLAAAARFALTSQTMSVFVSQENRADLQTLAGWMATNQLVPALDRTYPLSEIGAALSYLEGGHARAKVGINV